MKVYHTQEGSQVTMRLDEQRALHMALQLTQRHQQEQRDLDDYDKAFIADNMMSVFNSIKRHQMHWSRTGKQINYMRHLFEKFGTHIECQLDMMVDWPSREELL